MTVKEYLMQIILYDTRLKQKKLKLQRMREDCYSAKGLDTSKEKVHSSLSNGYNRIDKMVDYESKIKKDVENLRQLRETIIEEINSLDNYIYIELLTEKYVNKKSLFEIIKTNKGLCYSYAYIKTLHGKALNAFKVKYPNYFLKDNTF